MCNTSRAATAIRDRPILRPSSHLTDAEVTMPIALTRNPIRSLALAAAVAMACLTTTAPAQTPPQTVRWHVGLGSEGALQPGQRTTLVLTGQILAGWHVYGLKQHDKGPIELKFSVDAN